MLRSRGREGHILNSTAAPESKGTTWKVPTDQLMQSGQVVVTFKVAKDGAISDIALLRRSRVESFNTFATQALKKGDPAAVGCDVPFTTTIIREGSMSTIAVPFGRWPSRPAPRALIP